MTSDLKLSGKCMCGAVEFTGIADKPSVAACHCDMCRRWSSGPFFEVSCKDVSFQGEDSISKIRSSDWAERAFCNKCGSNLFYRIIGSDEYQMAAGLIDDPSGLQLTLQVFIDEKPPFYTLADKTDTMTGAEIFAAYAPKPD